MHMQCVNTGMIYAQLLNRTSQDIYPEMAITFREWFNEAVKRKKTNTRRVATTVGMDYSHLWRMVAGKVAKYGNTRPGFENTLAIGELLGDKDGALLSAGYIKERAPEEPGTQDYPFGYVVFPDGQARELPEQALLFFLGLYVGQGEAESANYVRSLLKDAQEKHLSGDSGKTPKTAQ